MVKLSHTINLDWCPCPASSSSMACESVYQSQQNTDRCTACQVSLRDEREALRSTGASFSAVSALLAVTPVCDTHIDHGRTDRKRPEGYQEGAGQTITIGR